MNKEPEDYVILEHGIQQILKKEEYSVPEILRTCTHVSDGFVYEETPLFTTYLCAKCGLHYDTPKL